MFTQKEPKEPSIYFCNICNFTCSKKSNYNKHLNTRKHDNVYKCLQNNSKKCQNYICNNCNKKYKYRQSLCRHKKICIIEESLNNNHENDNNNNNNNNNDIDNEINTDNNTDINTDNDIKNDIKNDTIINSLINENKEFKCLIIDMIKSNNDLQNQMIEICKNSNNSITHHNNNNNNINNSNNKTFNLQVFLNEDCKDAMNLSDFVNSLQLQLSDLDNMGKLGYTEGISKIIMTEMNELEQTKRPVHCSDIKRETLYVKDEDKWEKEQPDHPKLNKAIRKIEQKNFGLMGEWQAEHPTYMESTSEENNEFLKLISHTVNGTPDNINKVIKKIAKEVVINK